MGRMTSLSGTGSGPSSTANWPCELALLMRLLAQTLGFSFQGPVTPMNCARAEYWGWFRPLVFLVLVWKLRLLSLMRFSCLFLVHFTTSLVSPLFRVLSLGDTRSLWLFSLLPPACEASVRAPGFAPSHRNLSSTRHPRPGTQLALTSFVKDAHVRLSSCMS